MSRNDFRTGKNQVGLGQQLDQAHRNVIKNLEKMLRIMLENGDDANATKIKQAIITVQVTYNRARHKL